MKKPSTNKPGKMIRVPGDVHAKLAKLAAQRKRTLTAENVLAIEAHLRAAAK